MELVTIEEHCRDFRAGKRTDIPLYRIARKEGLCDFFELKDVNTGDVRKGWCEAGELRMVEGMGDGEEVGRKGWEGKMMVESGGGSNEDDGAASGMC